jgi:hypothetical protein
MKKTKLSRREMLERTVNLAVVGSMPVLLHACTKPEFHCTDVSNVGKADLALRQQLEYQDRSAHGDQKNCSNCAFYKAGDQNQCGQCTLVRGPIHPLGYCNSWAAKG